MNKNLAMSKPQSCETCAIHCATATGFSKVDNFSDFIFAGLFSSAFFLPRVKATLTPYVILERSDRIQDGFTPHVILGAKRRGSRGAFILEFN
ncbi:hypothetical protein [Fibrobacter sp.]|uniref:hypothetical protein n=1 Tax=Fibrobacter sp. TaxID=35828 RepID=UPI002607F89C|nr:hypothetical protein [Fibrobacter sp.]